MVESIVKNIVEKLTEPIQIIFIGVIFCLFLIIKMMIGLLNRKEDVLQGMADQLNDYGAGVREAVKLLEILVYRQKGKG